LTCLQGFDALVTPRCHSARECAVPTAVSLARRLCPTDKRAALGDDVGAPHLRRGKLRVSGAPRRYEVKAPKPWLCFGQAGNVMPPFPASSIRRSRSDAFSASVAVFRFSPATSYRRSIASACFSCSAPPSSLHVAKPIVRYVMRAVIGVPHALVRLPFPI
jgi:hypothetical protein